MAAVIGRFGDVSARREAREGLELMQRGKLPQAVKRFNSALKHDANCIEALRGLGEATFRDGRYDLAVPLFRKAWEQAPEDGLLCAWLGSAELAARELEAARASLEKALRQGYDSADVHRALGRVAAEQGRWGDAEAHWRDGLARDPRSTSLAYLMGTLNLRRGRWLDGWRGWSNRTGLLQHGLAQPVWQFADLDGREVLVIGNQGLGDELFFLRFVLPGLRARGARLIYRCNPKLLPLLQRMEGFAELVPETEGQPLPAHARVAHQAFACFSDDFPLALGADYAAEVRPSLRLAPLPELLAAMRERLLAAGPAPWIGVTWRAGTAPEQAVVREVRFDDGRSVRGSVLYKEVTLARLGEALAGVPGTLVSLQRHPVDGEIDALARAAGRPVADLADCNDDLERMLALTALLDEYVCVSNTNVHLRCLVGRGSRVLVPFPGNDWRWGVEGRSSPWYPDSAVYRQTAAGWDAALADLQSDLSAAGPQPVSPATEHSAPDNAATERANAHPGIAQAHALIECGRLDEARALLMGLLQTAGELPPALHALGRVAHADSRYDLAIPLLEKALHACPDRADWCGDLGRALLAAGRPAEAAHCLETARAAGVRDADHCHARGYVAVLTGDWAAAQDAARDGLAIDPDHAKCLGLAANLALGAGRWQEGFELLARTGYRAAPFALSARRPWTDVAALAGRRVRVVRNEGLGDELFALRYAPRLQALGARIELLAGPKIAPLLADDPLFASVSPLPDGAEALPLDTGEHVDFTVLSTDLPRLLWAHGDTPVAPPHPLRADPARVNALRARLEAFGPAPWVGVTWRAGHPVGGAAADAHYLGADGRAVKVRRLSKQLSADLLAEALRPLQATVIVLQRLVPAGEIADFEAALGRPVLDLTALADDLQDMLALLELLDDYVCVSNTNVHLRAGLGKGSRVLVPHPVPEWRWMLHGDASPWFPGCTVYRQAVDGDWSAAFGRLREQLAPALLPRAADGAGLPRVFWLTHGELSVEQGRPTSPLASARLRVLSPAAVLSAAGGDCRFFSERACPVELSGDEAPAPGDVLVISKSFSTDTTKLLLQTKRRGTRIVVDVCDNHFDHPEHGPHLNFLCAAADALVCNTEAMRTLVQARTGRDATVIADPYEGPAGAPRFAPGDVLKLLWFGHPVNLDTLQAALPSLQRLAERRPLQLTVVTSPEAHEPLRQLAAAGGLAIHCVAWSPAATWVALADCDLVIVPTLAGPTKQGRSPNRVVEALRAGRMVVAGPQPSHAPFTGFVRIDDDLEAGIAWVLEHAADVPARVAAGQRYIESAHAPALIGGQWAELIRALPAKGAQPALRAVEGGAPAAAAPAVPMPAVPAPAVLPVHQAADPEPAASPLPQPRMKLNLGCGDKILPGYINVDVVDGRAGKTPNVLCDLRALTPFADEVADEVLAVHVIEHFWRWEVLDVLKEWTRVLRPGGRMVLECPNLIAACEAFLDDPDGVAGGGPEGQRSMWVFYGDPQWKDPYMVHRWGYTPNSLAQLMTAAGLVNARQEPAQFKLREPRDMRIVAEKPRRG